MNSSGNRVIVGYSDGSGKYYSGNAEILEYNEELNEWEQVANELYGGVNVKMSADGNTVAVGRSQDLEYFFSGGQSPCCDNYVKIYTISPGEDGELYWEKVATINSGPRYYFGYQLVATSTLHRLAVAAQESYSVFDVSLSDQE